MIAIQDIINTPKTPREEVYASVIHELILGLKKVQNPDIISSEEATVAVLNAVYNANKQAEKMQELDTNNNSA